MSSLRVEEWRTQGWVRIGSAFLLTIFLKKKLRLTLQIGVGNAFMWGTLHVLIQSSCPIKPIWLGHRFPAKIYRWLAVVQV